MKFSEIIEKLALLSESHSLTFCSDRDPEINGVAAIDEAVCNQLSYIEGAKFAAMVTKTAASALILPLDSKLQTQASDRGIAIKLFYHPYHPSPKIEPTAVVSNDAILGKDVYIGDRVVIKAGVKIGDRVCIHPNVVIYPDVTIGDRTILHANCTIHERTQIGSDCVIHSGAVIGAEGFGFVPIPQGWFKIEQSGRTVLEDGVEIGCNSNVDRPTVGETRIGRNTKLDNLVQIGHGCQIGQNCAFAAQVGLAGGVKVGDRVILAGQVGIANQAKIGNGAIATAKSGIHNDIKPGEIVSSYPAIPHKLYLRISAIYKRLPEMYQTLKRLQKKLDDVEIDK
ncbi:MAG: UDP-3-O-(3-hydroxymyristoyl)glucosamine N-acyltransferase [Hydrococcus sp. Prado102]|nr:UDP-3-O-(3-hydroxymyristoyl)glucosamine N-acyltransferase [Hydrococcus sp. Prado102]